MSEKAAVSASLLRLWSIDCNCIVSNLWKFSWNFSVLIWLFMADLEELLNVCRSILDFRALARMFSGKSSLEVALLRVLMRGSKIYLRLGWVLLCCDHILINKGRRYPKKKPLCWECVCGKNFAFMKKITVFIIGISRKTYRGDTCLVQV